MRYQIVATLAILAATAAVSAGDKQGAGKKHEPANPLAVLERFAGEWVVDGKWSNGDTLHARNVYEWGLGKKIMVARTFVKDADKEYQRYEGIMAWHPEKKCLFTISFAFDGAVTEVLMEAMEKNTLHIGWGPLPGGKDSKVRQTIRFLDSDRYQWVVELRTGEDKWTQIIDATWKRKAK